MQEILVLKEINTQTIFADKVAAIKAVTTLISKVTNEQTVKTAVEAATAATSAGLASHKIVKASEDLKQRLNVLKPTSVAHAVTFVKLAKKDATDAKPTTLTTTTTIDDFKTKAGEYLNIANAYKDLVQVATVGDKIKEAQYFVADATTLVGDAKALVEKLPKEDKDKLYKVKLEELTEAEQALDSALTALNTSVDRIKKEVVDNKIYTQIATKTAFDNAIIYNTTAITFKDLLAAYNLLSGATEYTKTTDYAVSVVEYSKKLNEIFAKLNAIILTKNKVDDKLQKYGNVEYAIKDEEINATQEVNNLIAQIIVLKQRVDGCCGVDAGIEQSENIKINITHISKALEKFNTDKVLLTLTEHYTIIIDFFINIDRTTQRMSEHLEKISPPNNVDEYITYLNSLILAKVQKDNYNTNIKDKILEIDIKIKELIDLKEQTFEQITTAFSVYKTSCLTQINEVIKTYDNCKVILQKFLNDRLKNVFQQIQIYINQYYVEITTNNTRKEAYTQFISEVSDQIKIDFNTSITSNAENEESLIQKLFRITYKDKMTNAQRYILNSYALMTESYKKYIENIDTNNKKFTTITTTLKDIYNITNTETIERIFTKKMLNDVNDIDKLQQIYKIDISKIQDEVLDKNTEKHIIQTTLEKMDTALNDINTLYNDTTDETKTYTQTYKLYSSYRKICINVYNLYIAYSNYKKSKEEIDNRCMTKLYDDTSLATKEEFKSLIIEPNSILLIEFKKFISTYLKSLDLTTTTVKIIIDNIVEKLNKFGLIELDKIIQDSEEKKTQINFLSSCININKDAQQAEYITKCTESATVIQEERVKIEKNTHLKTKHNISEDAVISDTAQYTFYTEYTTSLKILMSKLKQDADKKDDATCANFKTNFNNVVKTIYKTQMTAECTKLLQVKLYNKLEDTLIQKISGVCIEQLKNLYAEILEGATKDDVAKAAEVAAAKTAEEAAVKAAEVAAVKAAEEAAVKAAEVAAVKAAEEAATKAAEVTAAKAAEEAAAKAAEVAATKAAEVAAAKAAEVAAIKAAKVAAAKAAEEAAVKAAKEEASAKSAEAAANAAKVAAIKAAEEAAKVAADDKVAADNAKLKANNIAQKEYKSYDTKSLDMLFTQTDSLFSYQTKFNAIDNYCNKEIKKTGYNNTSNIYDISVYNNTYIKEVYPLINTLMDKKFDVLINIVLTYKKSKNTDQDSVKKDALNKIINCLLNIMIYNLIKRSSRSDTHQKYINTASTQFKTLIQKNVNMTTIQGNDTDKERFIVIYAVVYMCNYLYETTIPPTILKGGYRLLNSLHKAHNSTKKHNIHNNKNKTSKKYSKSTSQSLNYKTRKHIHTKKYK